MFNGWEHHAYGGYWMILLWIVIVIAVIIGVRYLVNQPRRNQSDTPLEVLKRRYAAGEISKEEFEEKKRELSD